MTQCKRKQPRERNLPRPEPVLEVVFFAALFFSLVCLSCEDVTKQTKINVSRIIVIGSPEEKRKRDPFVRLLERL